MCQISYQVHKSRLDNVLGRINCTADGSHNVVFRSARRTRYALMDTSQTTTAAVHSQRQLHFRRQDKARRGKYLCELHVERTPWGTITEGRLGSTHARERRVSAVVSRQ